MPPRLFFLPRVTRITSLLHSPRIVTLDWSSINHVRVRSAQKPRAKAKLSEEASKGRKLD